MLLKCVFDVIRMDIFLRGLSFIFVFIVTKTGSDMRRSSHCTAVVKFDVAGSSIIAFKVTVQVKKTLIGPTPN